MIPPDPTYDYEVGRLVEAYKAAIERIQAELGGLDIADISNANTRVALAEVARILASLNEESAEWVAANVPVAARDGVARTLLSLGVAQTVEQAQAIVKFNRMNAEMVKSAVADTQADLLAVTQNVDRKVRASVRKVVAESMRANMAAGINGRRTIAADILGGLRKTLNDALDTGIIDAAGRRWRPEVYVDMLTRTKLMETYKDATINEAIARDLRYAVISKHGAKDACRFHEGRIIKLTADAPGAYPTYSELKATGQIWHPNCRHTFSPIRDPDRLPDSVKDFADKQGQLGNIAAETGKRAPSTEDIESGLRTIKVKALELRNRMLKDGLQWKAGAAESHLKKRKKRGHIPDDWTYDEYEKRALSILRNTGNEAYSYFVKGFKQNYFVFGDQSWIVIVGEDGVMETAFPPDHYKNYLRYRDGYTRLGTIKELSEGERD